MVTGTGQLPHAGVMSRPAGEGARRDLVPWLCFGAYAVAVAASAVRPVSPATWLSENALAWIIVLVMAMTVRTFRLSDRAYVQGLALLLLHTYASHYTYSLTPMGEWARQGLGLGRNHFDRLVHFAFGALMLLPLREVWFRREQRRGLAAELLLSVGLISLFGSLYELLEWGSAVFVGDAATQEFLGTQGDVWDTQADLACNLSGGALAAAVEAVVRKARERSSG